MKKLSITQIETLNGGICQIHPGAGHGNAPECMPDRCFGNGIAILASGNPNIPVVFCIA